MNELALCYFYLHNKVFVICLSANLHEPPDETVPRIVNMQQVWLLYQFVCSPIYVPTLLCSINHPIHDGYISPLNPGFVFILSVLSRAYMFTYTVQYINIRAPHTTYIKVVFSIYPSTFFTSLTIEPYFIFSRFPKYFRFSRNPVEFWFDGKFIFQPFVHLFHPIIVLLTIK